MGPLLPFLLPLSDIAVEKKTTVVFFLLSHIRTMSRTVVTSRTVRAQRFFLKHKMSFIGRLLAKALGSETDPEEHKRIVAEERKADADFNERYGTSPEKRFFLDDEQEDQGNSEDEANIDSDDDRTRPWNVQADLSEIINYPSGEGITDDEREEQKSLESEPPVNNLVNPDGSQHWASGIEREDDHSKEADQDDTGTEGSQDSEAIQYRPNPKSRRRFVRTTVKIYSNKRLNPHSDFTDPTHACANTCWKNFSKEEIVSLRQRWWFQGIQSRDEFKNELMNNRTGSSRPKFQLLGKPVCSRCTFWLLCINASQIYDGKVSRPRAVRVKDHRHEVARSW